MSSKYSLGSNLVTSSAVVSNRAGGLCSVTVLTDGVNAANVMIYDHPSAASGKILFKLVLTGSLIAQTHNFDRPIRAANGLYASLANGANTIVNYI